jgi:hypothetical protein
MRERYRPDAGELLKRSSMEILATTVGRTRIPGQGLVPHPGSGQTRELAPEPVPSI